MSNRPVPGYGYGLRKPVKISNRMSRKDRITIKDSLNGAKAASITVAAGFMIFQIERFADPMVLWIAPLVWMGILALGLISAWLGRLGIFPPMNLVATVILAAAMVFGPSLLGEYETRQRGFPISPTGEFSTTSMNYYPWGEAEHEFTTRQPAVNVFASLMSRAAESGFFKYRYGDKPPEYSAFLRRFTRDGGSEVLGVTVTDEPSADTVKGRIFFERKNIYPRWFAVSMIGLLGVFFGAHIVRMLIKRLRRGKEADHLSGDPGRRSSGSEFHEPPTPPRQL